MPSSRLREHLDCFTSTNGFDSYVEHTLHSPVSDSRVEPRTSASSRLLQRTPGMEGDLPLGPARPTSMTWCSRSITVGCDRRLRMHRRGACNFNSDATAGRKLSASWIASTCAGEWPISTRTADAWI